MTEPGSLRRASSAPPPASLDAEAYAARLIAEAAPIRLSRLFGKHISTPGRVLFRSKARRSIQTIAIETSALDEHELIDIMRFRLAQYLAVRFVDLDRIYAERIAYEPLDHTGPHDVHIIAGDATTGEIYCYFVVKAVTGARPGATIRMRDRPLFPVEEVHGWGVFNRLERLPDIEIAHVREVGRFVKNQRFDSLDERSIRAPLEASLALWRLLEHELPDVEAWVGDFEEGIAQARLAYFHVPMTVLHGTVPYEAETSWLYRRYQHRTVFPFAVLIADLPMAHARNRSIDRALSLPGKLALIRLAQLRKDKSPNRSSLEPAEGLPAIDEALVLTQPDVAMVDRLELIHEGDRLRSAPLFADLSIAEAAVLGTRLERKVIEAGETILREGDEGDALFVIESGTVHVRRGDTILATLGPGDHFGEIAIVTGGVRTADVVASSRTTVLRLGRDVYFEYLAALPDVTQKTSASTTARLANTKEPAQLETSSSVFKQLAPFQASLLGAHMSTVDALAGDVVVRQGEAGDAMYLIVAGEADVIAHDAVGRWSMGVLGPGDFFGEISLLEGRPRIADVVALTPLRLLRLDRAGFAAFLYVSDQARAEIGATAARRLAATEQSRAGRTLAQ